MQLMSCSGPTDRIESTVLIGVATHDGGYAKSLLWARLKYLSFTKVEFHCLMQLSPTQFSILALHQGPPAHSQIHLRHTLITHKSPDSRSFSTQRLSPCLVLLGIQTSSRGEWFAFQHIAFISFRATWKCERDHILWTYEACLVFLSELFPVWSPR